MKDFQLKIGELYKVSSSYFKIDEIIVYLDYSTNKYAFIALDEVVMIVDVEINNNEYDKYGTIVLLYKDRKYSFYGNERCFVPLLESH